MDALAVQLPDVPDLDSDKDVLIKDARGDDELVKDWTGG